MASTFRLFFADCQNQGPVHVQRSDCRSTSRCQTNSANSIPLHVIVPAISTRIEEWCLLIGIRICSSLACAFFERTRDARQCEVLKDGCPASRDRLDVIDVEGCFLSELQQATVFASIPSSLNGLAGEGNGDVTTHPAARSARILSSDRNSARLTSPSASLRSASVSGFP